MNRKNPLSATHVDQASESHGDTFDARFRLTRMLYPYEYWSLPMQEQRYGDVFIGESHNNPD